MNILITGCAGFIGFHVCNNLLNSKKNKIIGIDNINKYYDVNLKHERLKVLKKKKNFIFFKGDISNFKFLKKIFNYQKITHVINLAAQAGVSYSIKNTEAYYTSIITGF
jgi:UDP-glucuronate 4-epimerase